MINYRANVWALKDAGVERVIGPCAAGSLKPEVEPGHFVVSDQLVDRTTGRKDTFYDGPLTTHVSFADPYCPEMRTLAIDTAKQEGITVHERGHRRDDPGPSLLHQSGIEMVPGRGMGGHKHDPVPGGVPLA